MTRARPARSGPLAALLAVLVLVGCTQSPEPPSADRITAPKEPEGDLRPGDRPYYPGTPQAQQDIRDLMARVPSAQPAEWVSIARKLTAYGEPAVPQLVANLGSHEPDVQIMSAYVLGMIRDPRSLDALERATVSGSPRLRHEAATAMLRMGDRRGLVSMVQALDDADPLVRARAVLVLSESTGETFGYRADDDPSERAAAVARWRDWLARTGGVERR